MKMKFGKAYNGKAKKRIFKTRTNIIALLCAVGASALVIVFYLNNMRPLIISVMENKVANVVSREINACVYESVGNISYDDIFTTKYNDNGYITAITFNSGVVNQIKSSITIDITKKLDAMVDTEAHIPFGSLVGSELLIGLGPDIPVYISPYGFADVDFKDEFVSVGINQVKHVVYLDITADVGVMMAGVSLRKTVSTDILIAQNVISGEVPDFYTDEGLLGLTN